MEFNFDLLDLSVPAFTLKKEQVDAIRFCLERPNAVMSLQTGLGKTCSSIVVARELMKQFSNLPLLSIFIVPNEALKAFKKEFKMMGISHSTWESSKKTPSKGARVLLITHTALVKYFDEVQTTVRRFNCLAVVDEIHKFSNTAKMTQSLAKLRPYFKRFYGLTATTVRNDPMSLHTICNLVRPGSLGTEIQFKTRFCTTKKKMFKYTTKTGYKGQKEVIEVTGFNPDTLDQLNAITDDIIITRKLEYNLMLHSIDIPLENEVWMNYKRAGVGVRPVKTKTVEKKVKDLTTGLDKITYVEVEDKDSLASWAVKLIDLQKCLDNSSEFFPQLPFTNKEQYFLNWVKRLFDEGHIPIVYCFYLDTIERIKSLLWKYKDQLQLEDVFVISGQVEKKERAKIEDKIAPRTVTIINRAGTVSINLQKADTLIFYNIPWAIDEYLQAVGRITRTDTKFDSQHIYFLEYEGTIDNYRVIKIKNHLNAVEQIQGDQLTSSDGINLSANGMRDVKKLLLWCFKQDNPVTKDELLAKVSSKKAKKSKKVEISDEKKEILNDILGTGKDS